VKTFPLEAIERCSIGELKKLQLERLQWSLAHAYNNVPRYREKFAAAGMKPADCRALEDLARFPFTTKADLRETYPFGMFAVPMDRIVRIHASSGTTGKPKGVMLTHRNFTFMVSELSKIFEFGVTDGMLSVLPLHHTFEFATGMLVPLAHGAQITYLPELTGDAISAALKGGHITAIVGVPALWDLLRRRAASAKPPA